MSYADPEVGRARDRERFRRRSGERIARGLCPRCGERPPEPERRLCAPCAEKRNRASRARDARLRAAGKPRRNPERARAAEPTGRPPSGVKPGYAFDAARTPPRQSAPCASRAWRSIARPTGPAKRPARPRACCMAGAMSGSAGGPPASGAASVFRPAGRRESARVAAGTARSKAARSARPAARSGESGNGSDTPSGDMPDSAESAAIRWRKDRAAHAASSARPAWRRRRRRTPGAATSTFAAG